VLLFWGFGFVVGGVCFPSLLLVVFLASGIAGFCFGGGVGMWLRFVWLLMFYPLLFVILALLVSS
jgi:hypothetical protein